MPSTCAIVAFNVKAPKSIEAEAAVQNIPIISSPIIYRLMEEVRARVTALLPSVRETKVTGEATVLQVFDINVRGKITKKIAGCRGRNGSLPKNQPIRVMRQGQTIFEGECFVCLNSFTLEQYIGIVETLKYHK